MSYMPIATGRWPRLHDMRRRLRARSAGLDLDRRMGDREPVVQLVAQAGQKTIVDDRFRPDQMHAYCSRSYPCRE